MRVIILCITININDTNRSREGDWRERLRKLREDQEKEVIQVLSDEQNRKLDELKGTAF